MLYSLLEDFRFLAAAPWMSLSLVISSSDITLLPGEDRSGSEFSSMQDMGDSCFSSGGSDAEEWWWWSELPRKLEMLENDRKTKL